MNAGGADLKPWETLARVWRSGAALRPGSRQVWLRRVAISASFLKAIPCAALGGYFMWWLTTPMDALVSMLTFGIAELWLIGGVGYLLAAFLLSRQSFAERFTGGIIDATGTGIVAWVIFWLAERPGEVVLSYSHGVPDAVPQPIFWAIALVWIAASIPMLAWFLFGAVARFQRRRQQT